MMNHYHHLLFVVFVTAAKVTKIDRMTLIDDDDD